MLRRNSPQSKFRPAPDLDDVSQLSPRDQGPGEGGSNLSARDQGPKQSDSQESSKGQISLGEWSKEEEA